MFETTTKLLLSSMNRFVTVSYKPSWIWSSEWAKVKYMKVKYMKITQFWITVNSTSNDKWKAKFQDNNCNKNLARITAEKWMDFLK